MAYINGNEVLDAIFVKYLDAPTETLTITENGEYDVLNYLKAVVDVSGGGIEITDITLNADGTYTVTDIDNNTHTLTVTETNGQITAITYDGSNVPLTFTSGLLTGVGDTDIDVSRYPEPQSSGSGTIPFSNIFDCVESKFVEDDNNA